MSKLLTGVAALGVLGLVAISPAAADQRSDGARNAGNTIEQTEFSDQRRYRSGRYYRGGRYYGRRYYGRAATTAATTVRITATTGSPITRPHRSRSSHSFW